MNQRLFVLYGRQNSGKTCTIKKACELFSAQENASVLSCEKVDEEDMVCIVEINGTKVGFSSGGDIREHVENGLVKLKDCEIVVCATRQKGPSMHYIYEYIGSTGHPLYWIRQPVLDAYYEGRHTGAAAKVDVGRYRENHNQIVVDLIFDILAKEVNTA